MTYENEPGSARRETGPFFMLGVAFFLVILLTICCALGAALISRQRLPTPTLAEEMPVIIAPTVAVAPAITLINLPLIMAEPESESGTGGAGGVEIWIVTKIKELGYEMGGQRYDLATFKRIDGLATVKAYCLNPGWNIPAVGTEYVLNADGVFVPVRDPAGYPLQRFAIIQGK